MVTRKRLTGLVSDAVPQTDGHEGMVGHVQQGDVAVLVIQDEEDLKVKRPLFG